MPVETSHLSTQDSRALILVPFLTANWVGGTLTLHSYPPLVAVVAQQERRRRGWIRRVRAGVDLENLQRNLGCPMPSTGPKLSDSLLARSAHQTGVGPKAHDNGAGIRTTRGGRCPPAQPCSGASRNKSHLTSLVFLFFVDGEPPHNHHDMSSEMSKDLQPGLASSTVPRRPPGPPWPSADYLGPLSKSMRVSR